MKMKRLLGFAAVGALLVLAAPAERAQALSLANPGAAAAIQQDSTQRPPKCGGIAEPVIGGSPALASPLKSAA